MAMIFFAQVASEPIRLSESVSTDTSENATRCQVHFSQSLYMSCLRIALVDQLGSPVLLNEIDSLLQREESMPDHWPKSCLLRQKYPPQRIGRPTWQPSIAQ